MKGLSQIDRDNVQTLIGLAILYKQMGDPLESLKYCDYALAREPNNLKMILFMGDIQRAEGMTKEAEKTFREGLRIAAEQGEQRYVQLFINKLENPL